MRQRTQENGRPRPDFARVNRNCSTWNNFARSSLKGVLKLNNAGLNSSFLRWGIQYQNGKIILFRRFRLTTLQTTPVFCRNSEVRAPISLLIGGACAYSPLPAVLFRCSPSTVVYSNANICIALSSVGATRDGPSPAIWTLAQNGNPGRAGGCRGAFRSCCNGRASVFRSSERSHARRDEPPGCLISAIAVDR